MTDIHALLALCDAASTPPEVVLFASRRHTQLDVLRRNLIFRELRSRGWTVARIRNVTSASERSIWSALGHKHTS